MKILELIVEWEEKGKSLVPEFYKRINEEALQTLAQKTIFGWKKNGFSTNQIRSFFNRRKNHFQSFVISLEDLSSSIIFSISITLCTPHDISVERNG